MFQFEVRTLCTTKLALRECTVSISVYQPSVWAVLDVIDGLSEVEVMEHHTAMEADKKGLTLW